jgi:geranylgeranyl pyrophosphate synthase
MKLINDYSELIENEIAGISFPNEPKNLYDPLSYFLALGGKRMRPSRHGILSRTSWQQKRTGVSLSPMELCLGWQVTRRAIQKGCTARWESQWRYALRL